MDLASRATNQAQKFGAQLMVGTGAQGLTCDRNPRALEIGDGQRLSARAVIIATGAEYRRLAIDGLSRIEGAGVRSEEHTSELQSRLHLVCRLLLEKKKKSNL